MKGIKSLFSMLKPLQCTVFPFLSPMGGKILVIAGLSNFDANGDYA